MHCASAPHLRAKERQEIKTVMAAAKDEGGRPRGQRILLPEHWGPRPEKEFWGWWERDLRAFITALKGASVWQPRSSSTPLNLLSSKL